MITFFSTILSALFLIPPLGYLLVYLFFRIITKNKRKSILKAIDFTTLLFIPAVHFLIITIWGKSYFWLIIIIILSIAIVFVIVHWKLKGEIIFNKVLKGVWRFIFLFFFLTYLLLIFI